VSNYPPGVTGNEYEIAGPDREFEDERTCPDCDQVSIVDVTGYGWEEWWTCPWCKAEVSEVNEPDWD
jgi:hypothetical protein